MNNCKCPGPRTNWGDLGVSEDAFAFVLNAGGEKVTNLYGDGDAIDTAVVRVGGVSFQGQLMSRPQTEAERAELAARTARRVEAA